MLKVGLLVFVCLAAVQAWDKRLSSLRGMSFNPEQEFEWTKTPETRYYKRTDSNQVSPGSIPYFTTSKKPNGYQDVNSEKAEPFGKQKLYPKVLKKRGWSETPVEEAEEENEGREEKRGWVGAGDTGFFRRSQGAEKKSHPGSFAFYKRGDPSSFSFYKRGDPSSFSFYKRGDPSSFSFYKRDDPGSFSFYKRGDPGAFSFYKRAGPGDFGMYKKASPGSFGLYKKSGPGDFGLYKRSGPGEFGLYKRGKQHAEGKLFKRSNDKPIRATPLNSGISWKRKERSAEEMNNHRIVKRSAPGEFSLYKKNKGNENEVQEKKDAPGQFSFYKKSKEEDKKGDPGHFSFYKKSNDEDKKDDPGHFSFYKKSLEDQILQAENLDQNQRKQKADKKAEPGQFSFYKKDDQEDGETKKNAPGDFSLYKKQDSENMEQKKDEPGQFSFYKRKFTNNDMLNKVKAKNNKAFEHVPHGNFKLYIFKCKDSAGQVPTCNNNGLGPRMTRKKNGDYWCACACPVAWGGPECRERVKVL